MEELLIHNAGRLYFFDAGDTPGRSEQTSQTAVHVKASIHHVEQHGRAIAIQATDVGRGLRGVTLELHPATASALAWWIIETMGE